LRLAKFLAPTPELRTKAHGEHVDGSRELLTRLAQRMGVPTTDRRVRVLATAVTAVVSVEFQRWADGGGRGDPSEAIAAALDVLQSGLCDLDSLRPTRRDG
jgi:MftR C-terminal domain